MNPRVALWLLSRGEDPAVFVSRDDDDNMHRRDGLPWTIVYSQWIMAQWRAWAAELGYKDRFGEEAHRLAGADGYTDAEFDAWLKRSRRMENVVKEEGR